MSNLMSMIELFCLSLSVKAPNTTQSTTICFSHRPSRRMKWIWTSSGSSLRLTLPTWVFLVETCRLSLMQPSVFHQDPSGDESHHQSSTSFHKIKNTRIQNTRTGRAHACRPRLFRHAFESHTPIAGNGIQTSQIAQHPPRNKRLKSPNPNMNPSRKKEQEYQELLASARMHRLEVGQSQGEGLWSLVGEKSRSRDRELCCLRTWPMRRSTGTSPWIYCLLHWMHHVCECVFLDSYVRIF
jgi:hypothetical protein